MSEERTGIDEIAKLLYGRTVWEACREHHCIRCNKPAVVFKDALSVAEYHISGYCQACQDYTFDYSQVVE